MRRVLIADPNTAFATVIGEALQNLGAYEVQLAASGPEARAFCDQGRPDLIVVDVDLPDCQPADLIREMRQCFPGLPVVFIPFDEADVPADLEIQGVLTKPFFLPDLPELINRILGPDPEPPPPRPEEQPVAAVTLRPAAMPRPAPRPRSTSLPPGKRVVINAGKRSLVDGHIQALSHALRDEPVLLTRQQEVITIAPRLSQTAAATLAEVVARAQPAAGGEVVRFQGDSESTRYMLYSLSVAGDLVLSVALRVRIPLPTIRKLMREAAETLAETIVE